MKFKRHILMTSAAAALAISGMGTHAFAQTAASTPAAAAPADDTTVVVTGIRKSLQSALKQKRNADGVEEVITAEDIGKFPDKNVADSLARAHRRSTSRPARRPPAASVKTSACRSAAPTRN